MSSSTVSLLPSPSGRALPDVSAAAGFRPSAAQRRFVQLALAVRGPLRIAPLCAQVGISRTTYYRWLAQPGFRAWMSAQWVSALLGDGGRLLSIARARAASDFRYWRALAELIFDPRGLGLLTAWQQRLDDAEAGDGARAPLFEEGDAEMDDDLEALDSAAEPTWDQIGHFEDAEDGESEEQAQAAPQVSPVTPAAPMESMSSESPAEQFGETDGDSVACEERRRGREAVDEGAPAPPVRGFPPSWPSLGGRFRF